MSSVPTSVDVLVIGGGNAGICAALAARELGASVLLVEKAANAMRGGNSRHTRNLRCAHTAPSGTLTEEYSAETYWQDLLRVTQGATNPELAKYLIHQSLEIRQWMAAQGALFQPALGGTLSLAHSNAFFLGGGRALLNRYFERAAELGVAVWYNSEVIELDIVNGQCCGVLVQQLGSRQPMRVTAAQVVLASGGFQSNKAWLQEAWGPAAKNFLIRGCASNTGEILRTLLDSGARSVGDAKACHAVAIDARAPEYDGGIVSRLDCIPFGIVVNTEGQRFYDEGEDLWPKRYASWGSLVAEQPQALAYVVFDSKVAEAFMPSVYPPIQAASMVELAALLRIPEAALRATVSEYNQAVVPGTFAPSLLDDCSTQGLAIPKSHWAQRLDSPPYYAYPLRPGITFTYLGLCVDNDARVQFAPDVLTTNDHASNIFAAGEIMAGNILGKGYLAGIGMTIGTVFGRVAGRAAAKAVGC